MIVKMKFINISGPRDDIDRVTDLYLSRYEIQLESALSELKTVDNLRPFVVPGCTCPGNPVRRLSSECR